MSFRICSGSGSQHIGHVRQQAVLPRSPVHQSQTAARRLRLRMLPTWTIRERSDLYEDPQGRLGLPFPSSSGKPTWKKSSSFLLVPNFICIRTNIILLLPLTNAEQQVVKQRYGSKGESGHHPCVASAVDGDCHHTRRVSKWCHEPRHGVVFTELYKIKNLSYSLYIIIVFHNVVIRL